MDFIPDNFNGKLLDVPTGTAVFTEDKYAKLKQADITCLDYSEDMLEQAKQRFSERGIQNIHALQGDVGKLTFEGEQFDIVLSMNGFHAFPDKKKAFEETYRVLKKGGKFISCFYIKGQSRITDAWVNVFLAKNGWFTPPFDTVESLQKTLNNMYTIEEFHVEGSIVYFCARRK